MVYTDEYVQEQYENLSGAFETPVYTSPEAQRFVVEAEGSGFEVRHYNGRYGFEGPAISGDDLVELIRAVSVDVQWDNLGRGYIVYGPRDAGITAQEE